MDIWDKFKSKSGYHMNDDGTDSLGVDHSNFNLRDELKYQIDRVNNEQQQSMTSGQTPTPWSPQAAQASARTTSRFEKIQTPWSNEVQQAAQPSSTPTPWQNNQTVTPWAGGYDLSNYPQDNVNMTKPVDYSRYGEGFSHEFIDKMLEDQRFQQIIKNRTQKNEGGFSNHPNDNGGKTMYGISSKWYPNEDIPNLTRERANAILYRDYWLNTCINQLPDEFADIVFDNSVVQGQPTAITNLQKALGVQADGIIGPNTLNAISNADENIRKKFIQQVHQRNLDIVKQDPKQRIFLNGWTNRANNY